MPADKIRPSLSDPRGGQRPQPTLAMVRDYADAVKIHLDALDADITHQPGLYAWWAELVASSRASLQRLKLKEDILEAQLDGKGRKFLKQQVEKELLEKVTEAQVTAYTRSSTEWQALHEEVTTAEETLEICDGVKSALYQKSRMLEALAMLRRSEYGQSESPRTDAQARFRADRRRGD